MKVDLFVFCPLLRSQSVELLSQDRALIRFKQ